MEKPKTKYRIEQEKRVARLLANLVKARVVRADDKRLWDKGYEQKPAKREQRSNRLGEYP